MYAECPLVNPDPWPLLPSSTTNNSREQHGAVVGCSYLRTVVSEALQQSLRVGGNCDLVPIRPCDWLYQCHTDVEHPKQLCGGSKFIVQSTEWYTGTYNQELCSYSHSTFFTMSTLWKDLDRAKSSGFLSIVLSFDPKLHMHLVCARLTLICACTRTLSTFEIHSLDPGRVLLQHQ